MIYKRNAKHPDYGYDIVERIFERNSRIFYSPLNPTNNIHTKEYHSTYYDTFAERYKPVKVFECVCGARPKMVMRYWSYPYEYSGVHYEGIKCWSCA